MVGKKESTSLGKDGKPLEEAQHKGVNLRDTAMKEGNDLEMQNLCHLTAEAVPTSREMNLREEGVV